MVSGVFVFSHSFKHIQREDFICTISFQDRQVREGLLQVIYTIIDRSIDLQFELSYRSIACLI